MIIGTRTLRLRRAAGEVEVPIRIFAPEKTGESWSCRYEIDWPDRKKANSAQGMDAIQSLELALKMIGTDLYTSAFHEAGELVYETPGGGYGFPVPNAIRDMLVGDDEKFQ